MEIGSVLELEKWDQYQLSDRDVPFCLPFMGNQTASYQTVFYQSARNAIEALFLFLQEKKHITRVLMPDYVCETVSDAGKRAGIDISEYAISEEYGFDFEEIEKKLDSETCLFVVHYFGNKISDEALEKIKEWKSQQHLVIEDITMSLFSAGNVGFGSYVIGSIRKWLPIPDGGFVASMEEELPEEVTGTCVSKYVDYYFTIQAMKRQYVESGYRDAALKDIFMGYYGKAIDELFSDYALYPLSLWSRSYLKNYDLTEVVRRRTENYRFLYEELKKIPQLTIKSVCQEGYLPLGFVVCCEDRDAFLKHLIQHNIYCNVHWRFHHPLTNAAAQKLSDSTLTIPCDQRYGREEMEYIVRICREWYEDKEK